MAGDGRRRRRCLGAVRVKTLTVALKKAGGIGKLDHMGRASPCIQLGRARVTARPV
jgi:hypothetical protein